MDITRQEPLGSSGIILDGQMQASHVRVCVDNAQCYAYDDQGELTNSSFLLFGETVPVLEDCGQLLKVRTFDKYEEYISRRHVSTVLIEPTHFISVPLARAVEGPDVKSKYKMSLQMSSPVRVIDRVDRGTGIHVLVEDAGWIWEGAVRKAGDHYPDFVEVMKMLDRGVYGHGERASPFLDCSSLLQTACTVSGIPCPRIASAQAKEFGVEVPLSALDGGLRRGDAVFWVGHVAVMLDRDTAIHATEHCMGVAEEPLAAIMARRRVKELPNKQEVIAIRRWPFYKPLP